MTLCVVTHYFGVLLLMTLCFVTHFFGVLLHMTLCVVTHDFVCCYTLLWCVAIHEYYVQSTLSYRAIFPTRLCPNKAIVGQRYARVLLNLAKVLYFAKKEIITIKLEIPVV
jgi:ABC-type transport system involved in Fe-S cluster assembly fused permease/ATPase subunit